MDNCYNMIKAIINLCIFMHKTLISCCKANLDNSTHTSLLSYNTVQPPIQLPFHLMYSAVMFQLSFDSSGWFYILKHTVYVAALYDYLDNLDWAVATWLDKFGPGMRAIILNIQYSIIIMCACWFSDIINGFNFLKSHSPVFDSILEGSINHTILKWRHLK